MGRDGALHCPFSSYAFRIHFLFKLQIQTYTHMSKYVCIQIYIYSYKIFLKQANLVSETGRFESKFQNFQLCNLRQMPPPLWVSGCSPVSKTMQLRQQGAQDLTFQIVPFFHPSYIHYYHPHFFYPLSSLKFLPSFTITHHKNLERDQNSETQNSPESKNGRKG